MTHRRGFTLLETTLALVIGSLILAATLGVLFAVENADRALADQSRQMNDLAATQDAVRRAMATLVMAPQGTIRSALQGQRTEEEIEAILSTQYPDAVGGVPWRFEMRPGDRPRLEVVLNRPLLDAVPDRRGATPASDRSDTERVIGARQLLAHRGAFELRDPQPSRRARSVSERPAGPDLWWVPLPPAGSMTAAVFDEASLPPPTRLCRDVALLKWTAFIDSERVPAVRASEARQLPAFLELEIRTAGGGYGNWTFELGYESGPEFIAITDQASAGRSDSDDSGEGDNQAVPADVPLIDGVPMQVPAGRRG